METRFMSANLSEFPDHEAERVERIGARYPDDPRQTCSLVSRGMPFEPLNTVQARASVTQA